MTATPGVGRPRPDHRTRRRSIDIQERLAAGARHALVLAYLGFLVCGLLAPIAVVLALRAQVDPALLDGTCDVRLKKR